MKKIIKRGILIVIVLVLVGLFFYLNSLDLLTVEKIQTFINSFGFYGPLLFMLIYIVISLTGFSSAALTATAGLIFDLKTAMTIVVISATISAYIAFLIARYFSKYVNIRNKNIQNIINQIETKSEKNGFLGIAILRLMFLPYIYLSYAAGLVKKLAARDFVLATFFTNIFGSFFFIYLGFSLTKSIPFFIGAVILLILFLQTPKIIKKLNKDKKMNNQYDIAVIGAGSAGLTVAIGAAGIGAKVVLVEKEKIGGDCTHYGCVPSKSLIRFSKEIKNAKKHSKNVEFTLNQILKNVEKTVSEIYSHETPEKIKEKGIDVLIGDCNFISRNKIKVNKKLLYAKKIVIATGSRARIPEIEGLNSINYLTNKNIFTPRNFKSIVVIGGGPIGCELGQAFFNLGIKTTIIHLNNHILNKENLEASKLLQKTFQKENIELFLNSKTTKIEEKDGSKIIQVEDEQKNITKLKSDEVLISTGRLANVEKLDLDKIGIKYDSRGIFINDFCQTNIKNIYAVGDIARGLQFTHFANHQAKIAITNIIFRLPFKYEKRVIPRVTYTQPEIASVGLDFLENSKEVVEGKVLILKKYFDEIDRAITDNSKEGFFKIFVDRKGYILGACLVGNNVGELIGEISLAMKNKIKITNLADTIHPYPTYSYGLRNCADQFRSHNFTANKKKWIKKIFNLKGK